MTEILISIVAGSFGFSLYHQYKVAAHLCKRLEAVEKEQDYILKKLTEIAKKAFVESSRRRSQHD